MKYDDPRICRDPDHCTEEHNEADTDEPHHYGCGCIECMVYYQKYLK